MVEGPGCTLNGEKLRRLRGKKLAKLIVGATCANSALKEKLRSLEQTVLNGAESLGKELFVYFDGASLCLRLHFGMNGSVYVKGQKSSYGNRSAPVPSLHLVFCEVSSSSSSTADSVVDVRIYETAFSLVGATVARSRVAADSSLDVCSPKFDPQRALEEIQSAGKGRIVADVLLDQKILPGSGNIIKNESLFDAAVDPNLVVDVLSPTSIQRLVDATRNFSMIFYDVRKKGKSLRQFMRVYNRSSCGVCDTRVIKCRLGNDLNRITFFCPRCQDRDRLAQLDDQERDRFARLDDQERSRLAQRNDKNRLPQLDDRIDQRTRRLDDRRSEGRDLSEGNGDENSKDGEKDAKDEKSRQALRRWLQNGTMVDAPTTNLDAAVTGNSAAATFAPACEWSCSACTFLNASATRKCVMCGTERSRRGLVEMVEEGPEKDEDTTMATEATAMMATLSATVTTTTTMTSWSCDACTFRNENDETRCAVCFTERTADVVNRKRKRASYSAASSSSSSSAFPSSSSTTIVASPSSSSSSESTPSKTSSPSVMSPFPDSPKVEIVRFKGFKFRRTSLERSESRDCAGGKSNGNDVATVTGEGAATMNVGRGNGIEVARKPRDAVATTDVSASFQKVEIPGVETEERRSSVRIPTSSEHSRETRRSVEEAEVEERTLKGKENTSIRTSGRWIPSCRHGRRCDVRMVRKSEENRGRLYFACSAYKNDKCDFFKWADDSFPECGHGMRTLLRTVLKQGANNGRKFFCCAKKNKSVQCGFFQWAEGEMIEAIEEHCKYSNISDLG